MHGKARKTSAVVAATALATLLASCSSGAQATDGANAAASASPTAMTSQAHQARSEFLSFPEPSRKWQELPESGGVKYANVRGDLAGSGDYEAFVSFPAGKDNPEHYHKQDLPTVVLKGTFYAEIDGKRVQYPAGSYYRLPADKPHLSGCEKGDDCLLFQYQRDHFDLIPAKSDK
ncbi:cupin domain-containing protein [Streptomyces sp. NPDC059989]|uniref:cupin domain-containing protein n=1 Tax=Streptomyces sp. NPDC059989 TaxID=3347026 RepID=UPI0036CC4E7B